MKTIVFLTCLFLAVSFSTAQDNRFDLWVIQKISYNGHDTSLTVFCPTPQQQILTSDSVSINKDDLRIIATYGELEQIIATACQQATEKPMIIAKRQSSSKQRLTLKGWLPYEDSLIVYNQLLVSRQGQHLTWQEDKASQYTSQYIFPLAIISWSLVLLGILMTMMTLLVKKNSVIAAAVIAAAVIAATAIAAAAAAIAAAAAAIAAVVGIVAIYIVDRKSIKVSTFLILLSIALTIIAWVLIFSGNS